MRSLSGFSLSQQQISDAVNHVSGRSIIAPRFQLLDRSLNPVSVPGTDNATDPSDMTTSVLTAKISNDCSLNSSFQANKPIHRTADITFKRIEGLQLNVLNHHLRIFQDWYDGQGNLLFEVPRGIFALIVPDEEIDTPGTTWTISCGDPTTWLNTISMPNTYTVAAGTNYVTAIQTLLTLDPLNGTTPAGLPCYGAGIAASHISITASTATVPTSITFARGTTLLAAVNQLLSAINYRPIWVDEDCNFRSDVMPYYGSGAIPTAGWTYNTDSKSVLQPKIQRRWPDSANVGNVAQVYCEPNGGTAFSSTKKNMNPNSALSITNVGRAILPPSNIVQDDLIPDQATCDQKATLILQRSTMLTEQLTVGLTLNPFFQSHDHVLINATDAKGNVTISSPPSAPLHVDTWEEDLNARTLNLVCSRAVMV